MNLSAFRLQHHVLRSRVARRIFCLFILCALLPLTALGYFSFSQVTRQLSQQAEQRLQQTSKAAGMALYERLLVLETDLEMLGTHLHAGPSAVLETLPEAFRTRLQSRFTYLGMAPAGNHLIPLLGVPATVPELRHEEQQHLRAQPTLLLVNTNSDRFASILLVRALEPTRPESGLLIGEISPAYLWGDADAWFPMTEWYVVDQFQTVLFSSLPDHVPGAELAHAMQPGVTSGRFTWRHAGDTYLASYWSLFLRPRFFVPQWTLVHSQTQHDILEPLYHFQTFFPPILLLSFLVVVLLSLSQIRRSLVPIELLREATERIAAQDFGCRVRIDSRDEFAALGESFNAMATSLEHHLEVMSTINHIGIALSAETHPQRLLELIVHGAKRVLHADGGVLYLITENQSLQPVVLSIDALPHTADETITAPVPLYDQAGQPNTSLVAAYAVLHGATINIPDIYAAAHFDFSGNYAFDRHTGYHSTSVLTVPLKSHEQEIIGVLQLINAQDQHSHHIVPFSDEAQHLAESLASQAAVALTKQRLADEFKRLFEALIELIVIAIDEKSPYTGDHCRRVPILTMMLAEAACKTDTGPLKDFTLSEEELYELKIAALLHDCGKVTTPVHVVDKATKLETIFDRIHLLDTRFEVLKRDATIAFLRQKLAVLTDGEAERIADLEAAYHQCLQALDADRDFLRTCNIGDEFMPASQQQRVRDIARKYTWVDMDGVESPCLSDNEVHNLTISRGTLTSEEREIINYHVTATIKLLETLPYPKYLRRVPALAGAHHERMDGKGYPQGLIGEQIPRQGRILGLADIFEALTAKDRPYKKGKTLMESLRILGFLKQEGHIDPELFDVFMREKVYLRYAEAYLDPEQIDDVVLSQIPGYTPAP